MQWTGEGLIIGVRRHGETSVIVEAMVFGRGRHLGLIRGGRSRKLAATLQPGNSVQLTWRARLDEHLGTYAVELIEARAADLIASRCGSMPANSSSTTCACCPSAIRTTTCWRWRSSALGEDEPLELGEALARFELTLLEELGFGLDLMSCAVTGATRDLTHVSPKTGRAVSRSAAEPYLDRLLSCPAFCSTGACRRRPT